MFSDTTTRVTRHTPEFLNERIRSRTLLRVARVTSHPDQIAGRLRELDREWDIERTLEANASSLVVVGVGLGVLVNHWWLLVPFLVGAFLLQHALEGWCPPIRLFRRLGIRTHAEIASERYALRLLRGDFGGEALAVAAPEARAEAALRLANW